MTRHPEEEELTRLISGLLDGRLSVAEHERLESLLAADPGARRLYMQLVDQEIELPCLVASTRGQPAAQNALPSRHGALPGSAAVRALWRRWIFGVAAALGLLMLLAGLVLHQSSRRSVSLQPIAPGLVVPNSWSEDFEKGARSPWYGRIVSGNLPSGSKYAIAPVVKEYPGGSSAYVVQLPEDWDRGLFALAAGSTLHITYRLNNPTYVNVFMHTIPAEPGAIGYEMYQLKAGGFPGRTGEWQTASIPFSQFIRKVVVQPGSALEFAGGPPQAGELVTTLVFSSLDPLDLVIDRVWITPTGPGREEIIPTPP